MRIAMYTNTYLPHVGGVARSVQTLEEQCRAAGNDVRVVAPEFDGAEESPDVLRVPAIQNFNGSDFSVRLPAPLKLRAFVEDFQPQVIHSHHPFLLGDSALREAWRLGLPVVFTHHTLYENYTHYVPMDSPALKRAAIQLATDYCNLCDLVIAPSESIARMLVERGVSTRIESVPTGIDFRHFSAGDGARFRSGAGLPAEATVIGHVGRLAAEKNLIFMAEAVTELLEEDESRHFLLVGGGSQKDELERRLTSGPAGARVHVVGPKTGTDLADAYAAMDLFLFSSQSETQGIVLAEAMAARVPVVALDGPGVREIVVNGRNGILLDGGASSAAFAEAVRGLLADTAVYDSMAAGAVETAASYDRSVCGAKILGLYEELLAGTAGRTGSDPTMWDRLLNSVEIEWELMAAKFSAAAAAVVEPSHPAPTQP